MWQNGGNSYTVRAKVRTRRVSTCIRGLYHRSALPGTVYPGWLQDHVRDCPRSGRAESDLAIKEADNDLDGLNYLAGKGMDFVNKSAMNGTVLAHTDGNVPNLMINIPEQNEFYLGQLFYFFEFACGVSGYVSGVNPFNQPGVESYKKTCLLSSENRAMRKREKNFSRDYRIYEDTR